MTEPQHEGEPEDRLATLTAAMAGILQKIRAWEDADDLRDAEQALDEPGEDIPAEQVWSELGLS